jgi:hypothetical protein
MLCANRAESGSYVILNSVGRKEAGAINGTPEGPTVCTCEPRNRPAPRGWLAKAWGVANAQ